MTAHEAKLVRIYTPLYAALLQLPRSEAMQMASSKLSQCIDDGRKFGSYLYPSNLGDIALGRAIPTDENVRNYADYLRSTLDYKRLDGMTDDDFLGFWNEPDVDRRMQISFTDTARYELFKDLVQRGLAEGVWPSLEVLYHAAGLRVREAHGIYGHPSANDDLSDLDRPLPFELKLRVTDFLVKGESPAISFTFTGEVNEGRTANARYRESLK